jgi:galactokinase
MNDFIYSSHEAEYGHPPEIITEAPGVINLMGEHTDFHEGYVLQAGLDLTVKIAISRRNDTSLRFFSADMGERKRTTIANLKYKREDRWANYLKGVLYELLQVGSSFKGLNLTVSGNVPREIGLGSSAAVGVATALAARALFGFELEDIQLVQVAYLSETAFMGKREKITDQLGTFFAKEGKAVFIDLRSLDYSLVPVNIGDLQLVLTESGVKQNSVHEEIEERYELCSQSIEVLRDRATQKSLRDYTVQDLKLGMGMLPESSRRLCMHVVQENQRVLEGMELLKRGDGQAFGKLLGKAHESLRDNFEVSCPEIDWLVKRAGEMDGCYGAKIVGPGFGGCTLGVFSPDALEEYHHRLEEYEHIFGFHPVCHQIKPRTGARVLFSKS